jgi:hypothetical protein
VNIEDINFPRIVEEIQKIEWPENTKADKSEFGGGLKEMLADLSLHLGSAKALVELAGLLVNEFVIESLIKVHGIEAYENGQWMLEQMIAQVLEEAHPEIIYGILQKIKNRMLTQFTEEEWTRYGGW